MGCGYPFYLDQRRLTVSGHRCQSLFSPESRLGSAESDEEGACYPCLEQSYCDPATHARTAAARRQGGVCQSCILHAARKADNIIPSMREKENCNDNTMVETVFKTIKVGLLWRTAFQSRDAAIKAIGGYIDGFYTPVRRHSALG